MMHGALVFHRKCLGKRLGHQMYMPVFGEESSMGMWLIDIMGSLYTLCWVSLIAGVGYGMKQWGWNGGCS